MISEQAWKDALRRARRARPYEDRSERTCHELHDSILTVEDLEQARMPLQVIRSFGWYYPSDEELRGIILGNQDEHVYSYAEAVASQLPEIIKRLEEDSRTRRALLLLQRRTAAGAHQPSLVSAYFRDDGKRLHITVHARSVDLLLGLPANLFQAATLLEHVSAATRRPSGTVSLFMNSAHVFADYDEHLAALLKAKDNP